jgi:RNA polymerase sigma-70 factor (ECF subfamily)
VDLVVRLPRNGADVETSAHSPEVSRSTLAGTFAGVAPRPAIVTCLSADGRALGASIGGSMKEPDRRSPGRTPEVTDEQLLLRYTQGDVDAFEVLVRRYRRELFNFLARFVGDRALAEDVFQETFLQVHLSAGGFDVSRRLKPWLFTIAANKARDALRSRYRHSAAELDATVSGSDQDQTRYVELMPAKVPRPEETLQNHEAAAAVKSIVQQMPENLRIVLLLSYFHDFAYKDIAGILDVPLGTVKSRLHVAVREFAKRWCAAFGKGEDER